MEKLLSIIIPTYNMERYLERCLNSLIVNDELMKKLEVLVINDGSKDRSSEIAHGYEARYPQTIRVIDKENGNYGSCVNRGLKEASGKYIRILDSDDYYDTDNLSEFIMLLEETNADGIVSDMQWVDLEGHHRIKDSFDFNKNHASTLEEIMELPFKRIRMHSITYKTDNIRKIGYHQTEGISYTDMEWIFLPMTTCKTLYYFPKTIYYYVEGRVGQTMDPKIYRKSFWQDIKVQMSMIESLRNFDKQSLAATEYLNKLLISHSLYIYRNFFLIFKMQTCYEEMVEADKFLCQVTPSVAKELNHLHCFSPINYHFIKHWRKSGYPRQMLALKCGLLIGDLKKRVLKHER